MSELACLWLWAPSLEKVTRLLSGQHFWLLHLPLLKARQLAKAALGLLHNAGHMSASCSMTCLRVAVLQPCCDLVSSSRAVCVYLLPIHGGIRSIGCPGSEQAHQIFIDLLAPATFTTPWHQPAGEGYLSGKPSIS